MTENFAEAVNNTFTNLGQILKLVQIGNMHGHLSIHLGDMVHTETEALLGEYQRYLVDTFSPAEPEAYRRFQQIFDKQRWAVLTGEAGDGRETTAIALHSSLGLRVHAIPLDERPRIRLARTFPTPGNGYLVDLSALGSVEDSTVTELRALKNRMSESGAALTILTRPGQLGDKLYDAPVFTVHRPRGIDVLSRHLHHLIGKSKQEVWTRWPGVENVMRDAGPADAVRLARIAYQSQPTDDMTCAETWIRETLKAYGDWKSELDGWFAEHKGQAAVWDRIVLISVAVLEGREASEVFDAADSLARVAGEETGDAGGISGLGTDPTLETVGAKRVPDAGVRFTRPEYADAVLEYVWEQLPRFHEYLLTWTSELATGANSQLAVRIRESCARLALLRKDQGLTVKFFDRWAQSGRTGQIAADFAAEIAISPELGRAMRQRLYNVAKKPSSDHQAMAVARACAIYGRTNPASALTRLKWLAQAESDKARQAALDAVETLAEESELWFEVIDTVLREWCNEGVTAARREVALRFLARDLAASTEGVPERLLWLRAHKDTARASEYVANMWGVILDQRDEDLAREAADLWFSYAFEDESGFEEVARVLVRAVGRGGGDLSEERVNRRTVAVGRMVVRWCERTGVDIGHKTAYTLQARLYGAQGPAAAGVRPGVHSSSSPVNWA